MCYHHFWLDQYQDKNAWMLSAPLIQLEYASKQWKSTFSYSPCGEPVVPHVPRVGFRRIGIPGSVAAPLPLIDAVIFVRGVCPSSHSRRLYVPKPPTKFYSDFNTVCLLCLSCCLLLV